MPSCRVPPVTEPADEPVFTKPKSWAPVPPSRGITIVPPDILKEEPVAES